jgi:HEAT repeat protein
VLIAAAVFAAASGWLIAHALRAAPERAPVVQAAAPAPVAPPAVHRETAPAATPGVNRLPAWPDTRARAAPSPEELARAIEVALDGRASLEERARAVFLLVRSSDESAFSAIERLLAGEAEAPIALYAAEQLGASPHPRAQARLAELLASGHEMIALAALRGLSHAGTPEATSLLVETLRNEQGSATLRMQAAEALGNLHTPEARSALRDTLAATNDAELAESLLSGLGAQPFAESAGIFRGILASPELSVARKQQALEALASSSPDAAALLLETATNAPEPELRATSLESLALLGGAEDSVGFVLPLLRTEKAPAPRAEIYDVLAFAGAEARSAIDAEALLPTVLAEQDAAARLHGSRLIATLIRERPGSSLGEGFDAAMVPWLVDEARRSAGAYPQLAAVDALALAGTRDAAAALLLLSEEPNPVLAAAAAQALARSERRQTRAQP